MAKRKKLYEGKAKVIFSGPEKGTVIQYFKDDATAFNNKKKGTIKDKGVLNNLISTHLMEYLTDEGIKTHFIKKLNEREQLVKKVDIFQIEFVVRNVAAGSLCKRLGIAEGTSLIKNDFPLIEFFYKDDDLDDPLIGETHIRYLELMNDFQLSAMKYQLQKVNDLLVKKFADVGITLVDYKLEYGVVTEVVSQSDPFDDNYTVVEGSKTVVLADEISPDTCRLWDSETGQILDKDRFRKDLGDVSDAYQEVAGRLGLI